MIKDIEERYGALEISVDCHKEPEFYNRSKKVGTFNDYDFAQLVEDALTDDIPYLLSLVKKQREEIKRLQRIINTVNFAVSGEAKEITEEALKEEEKENEYIIHYTEGTDTRVKSLRCRDYTWEQAKFRFLSNHPNATIKEI